MSNLKSNFQVKLLERANTEHVQRAIEHEQAAQRANTIRAQLDIYKKQVFDISLCLLSRVQ